MKTAISIPTSLFEAADEFAARMGISRSLLYQRAVEQYLKTQGQDVIRESLDRLYHGDEAGRLDPAIEFLQQKTIRAEKDDW